jgi:HK97 family phage prohead protease
MEKKDYISEIDGAERRTIALPVNYRKEGEEKGKIEGIAAVVNSRTDLGWFEEEISPGAFDDVMGDDVRALFNHSPDMVLARTKSGTLTLGLNEKGDLTYSYETPDRSYARDLEDSIAAGDVDQSSFAFSIREESWIWADKRTDGGKKDLRIIKKMSRLYDVSPVTYPAYQDTTVAKRSMTSAKEVIKPEKEEKRKSLELYKRKQKLMKL